MEARRILYNLNTFPLLSEGTGHSQGRMASQKEALSKARHNISRHEHQRSLCPCLSLLIAPAFSLPDRFYSAQGIDSGIRYFPLLPIYRQTIWALSLLKRTDCEWTASARTPREDQLWADFGQARCSDAFIASALRITTTIDQVNFAEKNRTETRS